MPTILDVVCRTTGLGFAAIARVTPERWVCLAGNDEIGFGLKPGDELGVTTTLCNEVRQTREAVVIDHVKEDAMYCDHPTPALYGLQSYIFMPIFLRDGSFYGRPNHEIGFYLGARLEPGSPLLDLTVSHHGYEGSKHLTFTWVPRQRPSEIDVRPVFLRQLLQADRAALAHVIQQESHFEISY